MNKTIFVSLLLAAVANAQLVGWRNCGSPMANVQRIRIEGCNFTPCTCTHPVGASVLIEVDAVALANSTNLPLVMAFNPFGSNIPIRLLDGNACEHFSVGSCPALNGNSFTFSIVFQVPDLNLPPGMPGVVTYTMWNDFGDIAVCIQVDVILGAANNENTDSILTKVLS